MAQPSISTRARTKIIATVGPACRQVDQLRALVEAGADMFRMNMAHADLETHAENLAAVRRVSEQVGWPLAVLADLAGPKIRLGELPGDFLDCPLGADFRFVRGEEPKQAGDLTTTYAPLVDELDVNDRVLLADGTVTMVVVERQPDFAVCKVVQAGELRSRQGLNLPGVKLSAPALSEVDIAHAEWAADNEIDFLGLSFVRTANDVRQLKALLRERGSATRVIAKIEKPEALDELAAIVREADAVMVARGDLGVEIDVAQMPVVQKRIAAACRGHQRPVIIATQMLDSMQRSRRPTRAEVTDVANAILDGGDACMLSGETAIGKFPVEAVEMMNRVALATEEMLQHTTPQRPGPIRAEGLEPITAAVVYGAGHIAFELGARLIVVASHTGATAVAVSKQRNYIPTIGISDSPQTLRQMGLYWGVVPLAVMPADDQTNILASVTAWGLQAGCLASGDYVVLVAGIGLIGHSHNQVMVHRVP